MARQWINCGGIAHSGAVYWRQPNRCFLRCCPCMIAENQIQPMLTATEQNPEPSARILRNVLHLEDEMPQPVAEWLLTLGFSETDHVRVENLAERNNEGQLTDAERREFESYVYLDDIIGTLQSRALMVLGR
jgi:hypothetical protein